MSSLLGAHISRIGAPVIWKHKTGNDGYDDTYTTSTITVIWAHGSREARTLEGTTLICEALCKCEAAIEAGDVITKDGRDWPVLGLVGQSYDGSMRAVALGGRTTR